MKKKIFSIRKNAKLLIFLFIGSILVNSCGKDEQKVDPIPPGKPTDISVVIDSESETAVTVSWKAPSDTGKTELSEVATITSYEVQASKSSSFSSPEAVSSKSTSISIKGLEGGGTVYYFRVSATNSANKKGAYSSSVTKTLGEASKAEKPAVPTAITVVNGTLFAQSVKLSWTAPTNMGKKKDGSAAVVSSYKVEYSTKEDFSDKIEVMTENADNTEVTLTKLTKLTMYYARVYAKNDSGDSSKELSDASEVLTFKTIDLSSTPPESPVRVFVKEDLAPTEKTATIVWIAPENPGTTDNFEASTIVKYEIQYSLSEDFSKDRWTVEVKGSTVLEKELSRLTPNTKYYVRVRAFNSNSEGKNTSTYTILKDGFMTATPVNAGSATPPVAPTELSVSEADVTETEAKITWTAPTDLGKTTKDDSASLLSYIVEYADNEAFDDKKSAKTSSDTEKVFTDLKVATKYYVRVRAQNNNRIAGLNESPNAEISFETLTPTPPGMPTDFKVDLAEGDDGKSRVNLTWAFESDGNTGNKGDGTPATLLHFEVFYSSDGFVSNEVMLDTSLTLIGSTGVSIGDLLSNTLYDFRVRVVNDNRFKDDKIKAEAASEFTEVVSIRTKADASSPISPLAPIVILPENRLEARTILMLTWEEPSDTGRNPKGDPSTITKYVVEYVEGDIFPQDDSEDLIMKKEVVGAQTTKIEELKPDTAYSFRVIAVNSNTDQFKSFSISPVSPPTIFRTRDLSEMPMTPSNFSHVPFIEEKPFRTATISWEAPTNLGTGPDGTDTGVALQGYKYRYYIQDTEDAEKPEFSGLYTKTALDIEDLKSGKAYIFEIKTVTENPSVFEDSRESEIETYRFVLGNIDNMITITDENNAEDMSTLVLSGDGNTVSTLILNYTLNDNIAESNAVITVEAQAESGDDNLGVVESAVAADRLSGTITYTAPSTFDNSKETVDVVVSIAIDNPEGEDSYPKASRTIRLTRPMLTAIELPESTEASPLAFKQGANDVQTVAVTTVPSGAKVTYTSDPELPKGLTINPNTGVISGTPEDSMTSPSAYTIIATPTSESVYINTVRAVVYIKVRTLLKSITANDVQSLVYTGSQVTIASFTKSPENATVAYSSTELPAGLNINNSTGVISGIPTAATASKNYTITAQGNGDYHGSRSVDIRFEVGSTLTGISIPGDASTQANPLTYNEGQAITATSAATTTPANIPATYSITSPSTGLPSGLSLDSSTGVISGTPTGGFNASTKYTITGTATGNNQGSASTDVYIKIKGELKSITANNVQSLVYTGSQVTIASFTKSPENATVAYSSTELPAGLNINYNTGVISGTPTAATASKNYTITAQGTGDYYGTVRATIEFEVGSTLTGISIPGDASTQANPLTYNEGQAITATSAVTTTPANIPATYSITSPSTGLPSGLSLDSSTGVISGTPTGGFNASTKYTITGTATGNNRGSASTDVYIKIKGELKSITANNVQSLVYTGSQVTIASFTKSPANATVTYSSTELPAGLNINNSTGVISGTPTAATASKNYTITAQGNGDYYGTVRVTIRFEVGSTLTGISIPGDASTQANPLTYNEGQAITATSAVTTTPANIPATYSITSPSTGLPSGLSLDSSTGVISGTPTAGSASTKYTITGTATGNNQGSASTDVYIKINES